jgi:tryptophan-rich sensory protein
MSTISAVLLSFLICGIASALEGLFAGKNVKSVMSKLRKPRFSPPFWLWVIIGVFYYLICFAILFRILRYSDNFGIRYTAFALLLLIMALNAFWNYFFFRRENLFAAAVLGAFYSVVAIVLFVCLWQFDYLAAYVLVPYLLYLIYAFYWSFRLLKLNRK